MSDKYFAEIVEEWMPAIEESHSEDDRRRILRLFAKHVERDCRHKAASMAAKLSSDIHNMDYTR
jgi:hypothetical protein